MSGARDRAEVVSGPRLVMLAGLPGAGKSALAEDLARARFAVVVSVDPIEDALLRSGVGRDQPTGLAAYVVAEAMAGAALGHGHTVVIDAVNDAPPAREQWRELADRHGVELRAIEVVCSDPGLHRRRLEGRRRGLDDVPEPAWDSLAPRRLALAAWTGPRLVIDSAGDRQHNVTRACSYLDADGSTPAERRYTGSVNRPTS